MAHSISPLNAKPLISSFSKSFKLKPNINSIVSMVADPRAADLDHLKRVAAVRPQQTQPNRRPSPVGLWDRFPTRTLQQMMETMMDEPVAYTTAYQQPSSASYNGGYSRGRTPWEIKEGESEYKMRFDMPGMTREDVKVWVEENMLVVQAEKMPKKKQGDEPNGVNGNDNNATLEVEEEDWAAKSFGRYTTRIALPENVQFEKIKAEVKDGVLYITVPKASVSAKVLDIAVQ